MIRPNVHPISFAVAAENLDCINGGDGDDVFAKPVQKHHGVRESYWSVKNKTFTWAPGTHTRIYLARNTRDTSVLCACPVAKP